ncbi:MAG: hypothetical protein PHO83_16010 [Geobacteraceae bacterium]|nr:hypothetical protein [Geobacteraceae bacterium]
MSDWGARLWFRWPNNKVEWAIWVGTGFILLAIINSLLFVKKPIGLPSQAFTAISTTSILKDLGFGIIGSAFLFDGLDLIKLNKKKMTSYFVTTVGIAWFLYLIVGPAITSVMLTNMQGDLFKLSNSLIDKETNNLKKKVLSVADRSRLTEIIAKERFFKDGFIAEYTDKKGNTLSYQPTAADIQERKQFLFTQRLISILRYEMVFWIIVLVINVTGYVLYCKRKTQT